jgi:hypothetical protein
MRSAMVACLIGVAVVGGVLVTSQALAQSGQQQQQKQKQRPPPPPPPRCPDLGVGTTAFVTELPGQPPLAGGEVAITWSVRNDGNSPYGAAAADDTLVALEFTTAAGVTRIATTPAIAATADGGAVVLAQGHSVRGAIRGVLPPESAGRRLRLRLVYDLHDPHRAIPDCSESNNTVNLVRTSP